MTSRTAPPCDHDLRPGTTVCLRCQHAERGARRARQRQLFLRLGASTAAVGVLAAAGIAGATALKGRISLGGSRSNASGPATGSSADSMAAAPPASAAGVDGSERDTSAAAPATTAIGAGVRVASGVTPVIPMGRTALRDTIVAERVGDTVRVRFDLAMLRTRRADKFEWIMRSTLPQVYGAVADSALRGLPEGAVTRAGDLTATLPERGLEIPLQGGRISVWPETRPGRDGPLVVAYRAIASR